MSEMWTPGQETKIGSWTPAELRRFVVNTILTDPGALPAAPVADVSGGMELLGKAIAPGPSSSILEVMLKNTNHPHLRVYYDCYVTAGAAQSIDFRFNNDSSASYWYETTITSPGTISAEALNVDGTNQIRAGVVDSASRGMGIVDIGFACDSDVINKYVSISSIHAGNTWRNIQGYYACGGDRLIRSVTLFAANPWANGSRIYVYGLG